MFLLFVTLAFSLWSSCLSSPPLQSWDHRCSSPGPVYSSTVWLWISKTRRDLEDHFTQNHYHHYAQNFERILHITPNLQSDADPSSFSCSVKPKDPCRQKAPLQLIGGWLICRQRSDLDGYETVLCQLVWIFTCLGAEISISFIRGSAADSMVAWSCPFQACRSRLLTVCRCYKLFSWWLGTGRSWSFCSGDAAYHTADRLLIAWEAHHYPSEAAGS